MKYADLKKNRKSGKVFYKVINGSFFYVTSLDISKTSSLERRWDV